MDWRRLTNVKYFTDRSKAVLLLWIFYVFVLSCFCYVFVRVCLYVLCGHLLGKGWPLGSRLWCLLWVCHFPIGILGQVWYLIVSIPDLCTLTYFGMVRLWEVRYLKYTYTVHWQFGDSPSSDSDMSSVSLSTAEYICLLTCLSVCLLVYQKGTLPLANDLYISYVTALA